VAYLNFWQRESARRDRQRCVRAPVSAQSAADRSDSARGR
jgi:hypothetical protein